MITQMIIVCHINVLLIVDPETTGPKNRLNRRNLKFIQ